MNQNKQRKQLDAEAARAASMLLQDEVRARRAQERALAMGRTSKWQSVAETLREHPIRIGIGAPAAGVAIGRAKQSRT
jgi:hypothetical protein